MSESITGGDPGEKRDQQAHGLGSTGTSQPQGIEGSGKPLLPAINLPKGGGAIRGMGEKFATNLATGSGSMRVPLPLSAGRNRFGPELSLAYDSGNGNGVFGF